MAINSKSFRDFFSTSFQEDRAYTEFGPRHFKLFYEMAERFHVMNNMPANFDEDDLEFLKQFPHEYWAKAKQARYRMLFDAVKQLHEKRKGELGEKKLRDQILAAMMSGNWDHLQGVVPDRNIAWIRRNINNFTQREKEKEAELHAHNYIKAKSPHVEDPEGDVPFTLEGSHDSKASRKPQTFMAKPYLNRLFHKLETTQGHPFHPESGLIAPDGSAKYTSVGDKGKYGFDMAEPRDATPIKGTDEDGDESDVMIPAHTAGWRLPSDDQIQKRLSAFYDLNYHRMFGDLPEDAEWLPVAQLTDKWVINYLRENFTKKFEAQLKFGEKKYDKQNELRADAARMANEHIMQLAKAGKLFGPPIPGKFPKGYPIKVTGGEGEEKLVPPPLYLPHEMREIKVRTPDGGVKTVSKAMPIVKPAHFFRELGSEEEDYETDDDGQKKYDPDTKQPIYSVPQDKLRGHEGQFVHVDDDEFVKGRHRAAGAIDFNKDSEEVYHITKGDPRWPDFYEKVFGSQQKVDLDNNNNIVPTSGSTGFFEDIIKGIRKCWVGGSCGGATSHELGLLRQHVEDYHQIVVMKMMDNLGDPALQTKQGRIMFAYSKVGALMQKDHGAKSRRMRLLTADARNVSLSGGGTEKNIEDELALQASDKRKTGGPLKKHSDLEDEEPAAISDSDPDSETPTGKRKRKKGERKLDTSGLKTPYNLKNMRQALEEMEADAIGVDSETEKARALARHESGVEIQKLLRDGLNHQVDFKMHLTDLLSNLYQQDGTKKAEADHLAQAMIKSWIEEDGFRTSEQLVGAFKLHPLVQATMTGGEKKDKVEPGEKTGENPDLKEALKFMRTAMQHMRTMKLPDNIVRDKFLVKNGQKHSDFVKEMITQHFNGKVDEKILTAVQEEINKILDVGSQPAVSAAAAREIAPQANDAAARMRAIRDRKKLTGSAAPPATPTPPAAEPEPVKAELPPAAEPTPGVPVPTENWVDLKKKKDYVGVAHHPDFHRFGNSDSLKSLLGWFHGNADKVAPHEHASSIAQLTAAMQKRGIT